MRVIVAGGRDFNNYKVVKSILDKGRTKLDGKQLSIVSGMARGADSLGVRYATENNLVLYKYPAEWDKYGKSAGYKRNILMAQNADYLLAFWDGKSKGTKHMIDIAKNHGLPVTIQRYTNE